MKVRCADQGFSLIEIVLALGIVSFAIVGIMGLFPVAMKSAQESQRETRAAQIARRIFDELQSLPSTNTALIRGASITNLSDRIQNINLANSATYVLGYDEQGVGLPNTITPPAFRSPINVTGIFYAAEVQIAPSATVPGVTQVQVKVEAPAVAQPVNRSSFVFTTLLNN